MPTVLVTVTVNGGVPPAGIHVIFSGPSSPTWSSDKSFTNQAFVLDPGSYLLTIGGQNPDVVGASTTAQISGPFIKGPIPDNNDSSSDENYIFSFFFTI